MILGKKIGMTQIFEDEKLVPVTVIEAGPNFVVQKKSDDKDGYNAITLAYDDKKEKNNNFDFFNFIFNSVLSLLCSYKRFLCGK